MEHNENKGFLRLPDVLLRVPVSRSAYWKGVQDGRFPPGIKLSERTTAWQIVDIDELCELLAEGKNWHAHVDREAA